MGAHHPKPVFIKHSKEINTGKLETYQHPNNNDITSDICVVLKTQNQGIIQVVANVPLDQKSLWYNEYEEDAMIIKNQIVTNYLRTGIQTAEATMALTCLVG